MTKGVALVTGASRRIGRAIAERLATEGYALALHTSDRSKSEADAFASQLRDSGVRVCVIAADLASAAQTKVIVARATEALGPVRLLVNNASLFATDVAASFQADQFDAVMAINLRAPLQLAADFVAVLPKDLDGSIVNIIDQRVLRPTPQFFNYTLSKAALWTATRTMAQSFAPRIRVNGVGPGPILPNPSDGDAGFQHEASNVPLGHAPDCMEIAEAVSYLAAARSVTGQMIAVD